MSKTYTLAQKKYYEKLKDPRWQKRRLFILERDEWKCRCCENGDKTLTVHHLWYKKGKEPWDYTDEALVTLCEDCHETEREFRQDLEVWLIQEIKKRLFVGDLQEIVSTISGLEIETYEPGVFLKECYDNLPDLFKERENEN